MQLMKGAAMEMRTEQTVQNKELEQVCQTILSKVCQKRNSESRLKCSGSSGDDFTLVEVDGIVYAELTDDYIQRMNAKRLAFASIPHIYEDTRFEHLRTDCYKTDITPLLEQVKNFASDFELAKQTGAGLYIWSEQKGSGKTMTVCALANELLSQGKQVRFATSARILQEIRNTYQQNAEYSESKMMGDLKTCELLIIDDFGVEKVTDWVQEKMYEIINERYLASRPTIFTANTSIDKLPYNERVTNRVGAMSIELHYPEESIRRMAGMLKKMLFKKG
jgi:DNA replication protein DnaC